MHQTVEAIHHNKLHPSVPFHGNVFLRARIEAVTTAVDSSTDSCTLNLTDVHHPYVTSEGMGEGVLLNLGAVSSFCLLVACEM